MLILSFFIYTMRNIVSFLSCKRSINFYLFSAICNDNAVEFEVLDQIAELEEILTLNMISAKHETFFDVSALKQERNTWRLIGRLYHDELMQAQNMNDSIGRRLIYTFSNF